MNEEAFVGDTVSFESDVFGRFEGKVIARDETYALVQRGGEEISAMLSELTVLSRGSRQ